MADADTINVAAKITARVAELKVREGDRVQPGQVLFLLDSPEVAAKEQQAHGALAAAQAVADKADEGARSETSAPPKRTGSAPKPVQRWPKPPTSACRTCSTKG